VKVIDLGLTRVTDGAVRQVETMGRCRRAPSGDGAPEEHIDLLLCQLQNDCLH
jgi:hypothetical protein